MTSGKPCIPCIGSVLWDIIGRHGHAMGLGADRPGTITRLPGGVALNVAMTLVRFGMQPTVLTAIGTDADGHHLIDECARLGIDTRHALRRSDLPTDRYMAIEGLNGLIAAIADAQSLEAAGNAILAPLADGRLGTADAPFSGAMVLDGNLSEDVLTEIADSPLFAKASLRIVPASPGKATRLRPLLTMANATLYLNLEEAEILAETSFRSSAEAASALVKAGSARVLVTHGAQAATDACPEEVHTAHPPQIEPRRITGAGDTFVAAHIAAESAGHQRPFALGAAIHAAATYVSGTDSP
ncbi:PfkB family carbohydrate kinase [Pseudoruegeria sp. SK021]|uniref:PfkB family carbohydrate kinase n=1 Tax=Pseudoruegeria sp. SK021 TaxID=1933035 RepID=UPI000A22C8BA|nr:PfkB family carbohydrate kinase [Pseudoruegeria sp. SK021]OSP55468.1 kinase [Pseudoruegeria sp. SK021]